MSSRLISDLHPDLKNIARQFILECEGVLLTCTYRSNAEQNILYAQGRTNPGQIVTHAKGGQSAHNCTLPDGTPAAKAFDIGIFIPGSTMTLDWRDGDDAWNKAHQIGRSLGLVCGEDWPEPLRDPPHFELENWKNY